MCRATAASVATGSSSAEMRSTNRTTLFSAGRASLMNAHPLIEISETVPVPEMVSPENDSGKFIASRSYSR